MKENSWMEIDSGNARGPRPASCPGAFLLSFYTLERIQSEHEGFKVKEAREAFNMCLLRGAYNRAGSWKRQKFPFLPHKNRPCAEPHRLQIRTSCQCDFQHLTIKISFYVITLLYTRTGLQMAVIHPPGLFLFQNLSG